LIAAQQMSPPMHTANPIPSAAPGIRLGARPSAGPVLRISGDGAPGRERPVLLEEFFHRLGVRFQAEPVGDDPIDFDLTLQGLPGIKLMSGRLQGARYRRSRWNNETTEHLGLLMNLKGANLVSQPGHEIVLGAGEAVLVNCTGSTDWVHHGCGDVLMLRFPTTQIAPRLPAASDYLMRRIPRDAPALGLLASYVDVVSQEPACSDRGLQQTIASHLYDLIAVAVGATRDAAEMARGRGLRVARLRAIKQDIARNLAQPDLSVATLALRHGCTPRFIQRLLESEGTSFSEYLLAQRLARAHRMLTDPYRAGEKISMIAFDAGFGDLSYFNRSFRRRYGDTPSAIRMFAREADRQG
jgi:AraC-like DNA-binding protein